MGFIMRVRIGWCLLLVAVLAFGSVSGGEIGNGGPLAGAETGGGGPVAGIETGNG